MSTVMRPLTAVGLLCCVVFVGCFRNVPDPLPPDAGHVDVGVPPISTCRPACIPDSSCAPCVVDAAASCVPNPAPWAPGTPAFVNASAEWGLSGNLGGGTRISAADLDGDGRTDLAVRRAGNHRDDPSDGGTRAVWLLRNTGSGFVDVTAGSGFLQNRTDASALGRPAEIVVFADVDNDGDVDAYTGASATVTETSEVVLNNGGGTFVLGPLQSDLRREGDAVAGATFTDVNRDGKVDLWIGGAGSGSGTQDRLYLGDGTGAFYDLTEPSGLTTQPWNDLTALNEGRGHSYAWGTTACDLNDDGFPELLTSSYGRSPNHLWQSQGMTGDFATWQNRSVASGFAWDPRTDWTDNESARCYCKFNRTAPDCATVPEPQFIVCNSTNDAFRWNHAFDREPYRLGGNTGSSVCGDVNADGALDVLNLDIVHWDVGSSSDPSELLYNAGEPDVRFDYPGNAATGLTRPHPGSWDDGDITGALFDFDNDGRLDVYIGSTDYPGTRAWLYQQQPDGTFAAVNLADGIDHTSAHGVAVADFDQDGDLDLVLGHSRNRCGSGTHCYPDAHARFFRNEIGTTNNWLRLELVGTDGVNRSAIGARVTVKTASRTQTFEVGGGHGHYGLQHELTVHAGLGADCAAEVTVRWPDAVGTTQTFQTPANLRLRLPYGERPEVVDPT